MGPDAADERPPRRVHPAPLRGRGPPGGTGLLGARRPDDAERAPGADGDQAGRAHIQGEF